MPTTKARINITVSDDIKQTLEKLARRDRVPAATKAVSLLAVALEIEEDVALNYFAERRDVKRARFVSHKKAWR